ncbi:MAG: hypothetical protein LAO79_03620 [Acidobacteriia bacterium]|nr:hypothetical protein [Terriglobia bacterium]
MRIIVALALGSFLCAQPPRQEAIARLEAALKLHPENPGPRGALLRLYYDNPLQPSDAASRAGRRRNILWLIEKRPDAPDLATMFGVIDAEGVKADPEGAAESARLWREQIAKPDASSKVLANAAWFFKMSDREKARALADRALERDAKSPEAARMKGVLDVLLWLGATRLERNDVVTAFDPARSETALREIESSDNAALLAGAGQFLLPQGGPQFQDAMGAPDALDRGERWIAKAHELDPSNAAYRSALAQVYQREAGATLDPRWKVQLLAKTIELSANESQRAHFLADLASAEWDAAEDQNAQRDANAALSIARKDDYTIHVSHTILGSAAAAHGDLAEAKQQLLDSARVKTMPAPRMSLAQDLLEHGQSGAVVEYLELCRAFWKSDRGFIDHFEPLLRAGKKPELLAVYNPAPPPKPVALPAPELIDDPAMLRWTPVPGAESYVVEWDVQQNGRWEFDADGSVRVIPTGDTSAKAPVAIPLRWRVYAVGRSGAGVASSWQIRENAK